MIADDVGKDAQAAVVVLELHSDLLLARADRLLEGAVNCDIEAVMSVPPSRLLAALSS